MSRPHSLRNLLRFTFLLTATLFASFGCGKAKEDAKAEPAPGTPFVKGGKDQVAATPKAKSDLINAKANFSMDADVWHSEWEKNPKAAKEKYKGKIIELSGTVRAVSDDPYLQVGYIYLSLDKSRVGLRCASPDLAPWLKTGPGCKVKIRGVVPDRNSSGELYPCDIVQTTTNTCLEITAAQLAKEVAADKAAAAMKYDTKWLIVEGELTSIEPSKADKGYYLYLTLKGEGAVNVRCFVANQSRDQKKANEALKVGQKLKVCGEADIEDGGKGPTLSSSGNRMVTPVP